MVRRMAHNTSEFLSHIRPTNKQAPNIPSSVALNIIMLPNMPDMSNDHASLLVSSEGTQVLLVDYIKHVSRNGITFIIWHSWAHALVHVWALAWLISTCVNPLGPLTSQPHEHTSIFGEESLLIHVITLFWGNLAQSYFFCEIEWSPGNPNPSPLPPTLPLYLSLSLPLSLTHTHTKTRTISHEISNNFFSFTRSFQSSFPKSSR